MIIESLQKVLREMSKWPNRLMQPAFSAFTDVFCYPSQISAWCQEPLLV